MKTIKFLMLSAIIAILATACQPDKAALEKAKAEGIKIGYDSAKRELNPSAQKASLYVSQHEKYLHPGNPGHIHDESLAKSSKPLTGQLVITSDISHNPIRYVNFINPQGFELFSTDDYKNNLNHRHLEYKLIQINDYDSIGKVIGVKEIALITGVIPADPSSKSVVSN